MSPSTPKKTRRPRGEGAVFQRCESRRGCPPTEPVIDDDGNPVLTASGKPKMARPHHDPCRGTWIARLETEDGERIQVTGRTENQAMKKLEEARREFEQHGQVAKAKTVDAWFWYWVDEVADLRPNTRTNYKSIYRTHVKPKIGHREIRKLATSPNPLRTLLTSGTLADLGSTRRQAYIMLNRFFDDARREGFATRNPMDLVKKPKPQEEERAAPSTTEMRTILSHNARTSDRLKSRWVAVPFTLQRPGECLGLEWDRVDFENNVLDVTWQLQDLPFKHGCGDKRGEAWPCGKKRAGSCPERQYDVEVDYEYRVLDGAWCLVRPKSKKGKRIIPLLPSLRLSLEQRYKLYEKERKNYTVDHGLVWPRMDGRPMTFREDGASWKALLENAGIATTYDLYGGRHTGATLLLEAGVPDPVVQKLMGHARKETTHGYQHAEMTLIRRYMMDAIENTLAIGG